MKCGLKLLLLLILPRLAFGQLNVETGDPSSVYNLLTGFFGGGAIESLSGGTTNIAIQSLVSLFGSQLVGYAGSSTQVISSIFYVFNIGLITMVGLLLSYTTTTTVLNTAGEGTASAPVFEMALDSPLPPRDLSVVIAGELTLNTSWLEPLDNGDGLVTDLSAPRPLIKYRVEIDEVEATKVF